MTTCECVHSQLGGHGHSQTWKKHHGVRTGGHVKLQRRGQGVCYDLTRCSVQPNSNRIVVARVGVFSWLPLCSVVGLRWGLTLLACACASDGFML